MDVKMLDRGLSVSPQLAPLDIEQAAAKGFRSIINNRPDHEAPDQPTTAEVAAAAARHGLRYRYLPVISGKMTDSDVDDFAAALAELEGPVLAFCRTGTRCASLWALSSAAALGVDQALNATGQAGYDLSALRPKLEARAAIRSGGSD